MKAIVKALARWFWILILCLILGWFGGKELAVLIPPTYQATALIQLNAQSHTSSIVQPVAAYSALILSDSVLGTVLKKYPNLDRTEVATKQLTVALDNGSQTITLQVTLPKAREAAALANELAQLLVTQQNAYIMQQYEKELQILNTRIAGEKHSIDQLNQKIIATPSTSTTVIQQLQSQVSQYQNLENQDISTQQTLLTQQALYSQPLSVVQTANVPTKPSSIIGLIPLTPIFFTVMLMLGVFIIYLLERRANRINNVYALQQKKIMPILGALRWSQVAPQDIPLKQICEAKTSYAEECRVMMADVLFHAESAQARILAITSIKGHAGNSSIATALAVLLAQSKRRVLLIDAHLAMPSLYKRLGVPNKAGLAMMLEEAHKLKVPVTSGGYTAPGENMSSLPVDSYVLGTSIPNLFIVPAGEPSVNPSSLLSMPEMDQFLKYVARRSDYIIIDCPALTHAEAHVLGSLSDQTFLVIDAAKDRIKQVVSIKEELMNTSVKLSGFIVNKLGRWI